MLESDLLKFKLPAGGLGVARVRVSQELSLVLIGGIGVTHTEREDRTHDRRAMSQRAANFVISGLSSCPN